MEKELEQMLQTVCSKGIKEASSEEIYAALLQWSKEKMNGMKHNEGDRKLYYISAEFLVGKLLSNNLINLGVFEEVREVLKKHGHDLTEIEEVGHNQHLTASRGREPGLQLQRDGRSVGLVDWATQILTEMEAVAQRLDAWAGGDDYQQALRTAWERVQNPALLPSAQVLQAVQAHDDAFVRFVTERSVQARVNLQSLPLPDAQTARFKALAEESLQAQQAIEAADTLSFEDFRKEYVSPLRLKP